jgi:hypothetical protein
MKLSSYVVVHDYGFAPNPFGGVLTLATCKPDIRKSAELGDWIMGTGSKQGVGSNRLLFAGCVSQVLLMDVYGSSSDFKSKIPLFGSDPWKRRGDNIYVKENGQWRQRKNPFHDEGNIAHDLSGKNVLVCQQFWYFGAKAPQIPTECSSLIKVGSKHKNNIGNPAIHPFFVWLQSLPAGLTGEPSTKAA